MAPRRCTALDDGAVAAEYGVLLGFVTIAIAIGIGLYGSALAAFISRLAVAVAQALGV